MPVRPGATPLRNERNLPQAVPAPRTLPAEPRAPQPSPQRLPQPQGLPQRPALPQGQPQRVPQGVPQAQGRPGQPTPSGQSGTDDDRKKKRGQ
jgi:hypothetical protein